MRINGNMLWQLNTFFLWYWYSCFRWSWLVDCKWVYAPINLTTAFLSIFILSITITFHYVVPLKKRILLLNKNPISIYILFFLCALVIFLTFRNIYYTAEDLLDLRTVIIEYWQSMADLGQVLQQTLFVVIDLLMVAWCTKWFNSVIRFLERVE